MRRPFVLALLVLAALAATATSAFAETKTRTVPGELRFEYGASPNDPGNCSAIVFIRWADVRGTTGATANYTWRGQQKSKFGGPPFDDHYEWVRAYDVEPGYHWIQIGKSWADGAKPNDCSELSEKQKADYDLSAGATFVELTIEETAECVAAREALAARNRAVTKARARLAAAKGRTQRNRARRALRRAKARRAAARKRVEQLC